MKSSYRQTALVFAREALAEAQARTGYSSDLARIQEWLKMETLTEHQLKAVEALCDLIEKERREPIK